MRARIMQPEILRFAQNNMGRTLINFFIAPTEAKVRTDYV